jgi:hypothetical protein
MHGNNETADIMAMPQRRKPQRQGDECDVMRIEFDDIVERLYRLEDMVFALDRQLAAIPGNRDPQKRQTVRRKPIES